MKKKYYRYGYVDIKLPNHPKCNHLGCVPEHRLVMEKYLGRYLTSKEVVHHLDFNHSNNNIENLYLFNSNKEHLTYHKRLESYILEELGFNPKFRNKKSA